MTNDSSASEALDVLSRPAPAIILAARAQYLADFPELMAHRTAHPAEKWVAYHGGERLGIGASKKDLIRHGVARGLDPRELLVVGIDPAVADPNG